MFDHQSGPRRGVLGVVRIRRLEPGPREAKIQVDRIVVGKLEVQPVEHVLLIAVIVEDLILRAIQETACVHAAGGNEVPPLLPPVAQDRSRRWNVPNVP